MTTFKKGDIVYWSDDPIAMKQKTFKQELNLILKESTDE